MRPFTRGYNIIIPEDGVNAFTKENHESRLSYGSISYARSIYRYRHVLIMLLSYVNWYL
jgi:hypothetical protein